MTQASPLTESDCSNIAAPAVNLSGTSPLERVGAVLQALSVGRETSDQELRQHAHDCGWLMERAYERFQRFGDPAGRDEAMVVWLDRRNQALRMLRDRGTQLGAPGNDASGFFASDEAQAMGKAA